MGIFAKLATANYWGEITKILPARPTHNAPPVQARPPCKGWALMGNKHDHKPGTNLQRAPIANNGRQPAGVLA